MTMPHKVEVERLQAGQVVVTRLGSKLKLHGLAGMPGDRILLGRRCDRESTDLEAWPVWDLESVRVEA